MEEEPPRRTQQTAASPHRILRLFLPDDLVCRRIHRREHSRSLESRRINGYRISILADMVDVSKDVACYVRQIGLWTERHRGPGVTVPSEEDRCCPKWREETAALVVTERLGTQRHVWIADRVGLGLRCLHSRLLRHGSLFDPDERPAVRPIKNVE